MLISIQVMYIRLDNAINLKLNNTTVCGDGYVLIKATNQCLRGKQLSENCKHSEQCQLFDYNAICDDNRFCGYRCPAGLQFNPKVGKCHKRFNENIRSKLRDLAISVRARNKSGVFKLNQLLLSNGSRKINLFSLLEKSSNARSGVCSSDYRWNNSTNNCEANPYLIYSGSLLMTLTFSVAFVSLILMLSRRRQNRTINLFNSFNFSENRPLAQNVYFVAIPPTDSTPPSYQECLDSNETTESQTNKLPSYEEAIASNQ